jgi:hypothetical protein
VKARRKAITRKWLNKHASAIMDIHATIEELLETIFYVWSIPRLYNEPEDKL